MGRLRLCKFWLHDRRPDGGFQRVLRQRGRQWSRVGRAVWIVDAGGLERCRDGHDADYRRLRRLHARKQWLLRLSTIGCVLATAALALAGRGDVVIAVVAIVGLELLLSDRRIADRRIPSGDRAPAGARQGVGLGLELRLPGRTCDAGRVPRICDLGAGAGQGRRRIRSGDDVDHCRNFGVGCAADAVHPARARGAAAQKSLDVVRESLSRLASTLKHVGLSRLRAAALVQCVLSGRRGRGYRAGLDLCTASDEVLV